MRPEPFLHAPEDKRFAARVGELAQSLGSTASPPGPCIWDDTEALIKTSVYSDERVLIMGWVLAWLRGLRAARTCAPRLHVVSDAPAQQSAFADLFRDVPITSKYYHTYDICIKLLLFVVLLHITSCVNYLIGKRDGSGAAVDSVGSNDYVWSMYITFALLLGDAELGIFQETSLP